MYAGQSSFPVMSPRKMNGPQLRFELENNHRQSYGWALCCCARDALEAEEVLQIAYLKVLEGKARYDGRAEFKTWLFGVIRLTAAEQRRRRLLGWLRLASYQPRPVPREQPDEALDRTELQAGLLLALARLPRRQREVLQLVFCHDMSLSEAAEAMGVSLGSSRTHYERGKRALRKDKVIDEYGPNRSELQAALW